MMDGIESSQRGLEIRDLAKSFVIDGRVHRVLCGVNVSIARGEFVVIVGESGSGKTTLLRIIAGLEAPDGGSIEVSGKKVRGVSPERGMVFQEPRLLPWLTVSKNISLGLELRGFPAAAAERKVKEFLDLVGLGKFAAAYPSQLSGGMAQRAGIARALVTNPEILLLDEPLGALDAMTKMRLQRELERIWQQQKITMLMVTHDTEEAVYLADRIIILSDGDNSIKRTILLNLPRPRNRSSKEFGALRQALLSEFQLFEPEAAQIGHRGRALVER